METLVLEKTLENEQESLLHVLVLVPRLMAFNVPKPLELEICGRSIMSWVESAVSHYPYKTVDVAPTDDILSIVRDNAGKHKYTMIVYADSPLLTSKTVDSALNFAVNFSHKAVQLPRGWLFETQYIQKSNRLNTIPLNDVCAEDFLAIYNYQQLALATTLMRGRINTAHMENGVQISDPNTTFIDTDVTIEGGAVIEPNTTIRRNVRIRANAKVGPYAHVRSNSTIGKDCKIGNFVEIKGSIIGDGTKISHLAYVGDATIGKNCNIGCGVVFCNYDGEKKHKTTIGDNVFVGSNSNLVAPLTLESDSFVAAGSTIVANVPSGALAIGRARQENKEGWKNKPTKTPRPTPTTPKPKPKSMDVPEEVTIVGYEPEEETIFTKEVRKARTPKPLPLLEIIEEVEEEIEAQPEPESIEETSVVDEEANNGRLQIAPTECENTDENAEAITENNEELDEDTEEIDDDLDTPECEDDEVISDGACEKVIPKFDWDSAEIDSFYEGRPTSQDPSDDDNDED